MKGFRKPKVNCNVYLAWEFRWLPYIMSNKLRWKDKWNTPRCELEPSFRLEWLWFGINCWLGDDDYWEQWLWIKYYSDGDVQKAKDTWDWIDSDTKQSTWKD